jgi:hypothetical protein
LARDDQCKNKPQTTEMYLAKNILILKFNVFIFKQNVRKLVFSKGLSLKNYIYFTLYPILPFLGVLEKIFQQKKVSETEILCNHPTIQDKNDNCCCIL